jgi:hypothetical protein
MTKKMEFSEAGGGRNPFFSILMTKKNEIFKSRGRKPLFPINFRK